MHPLAPDTPSLRFVFGSRKRGKHVRWTRDGVVSKAAGTNFKESDQQVRSKNALSYMLQICHDTFALAAN